MSDNTQTLPIGTILDSGRRKYTIKKVLGAGSFGITYLATSTVTDGNVSFTVSYAIKEHFMTSCYRANDGTTVLCTPSAKTEVAMSRTDFQTEAKRLQEICQNSHNIVNVNETFEANGTAYYVMEYLDGGNPTMTSEAEAIKIVKQIASALDIIHQAHVLHLDVKPDNIVMKTDTDGNTYPVLIDFGVSKHFSSSGKPTSHLTAKGASEGYAPQEQYANIESFSPKYDVYAIGAVLLYLVSGKHAPNAFNVSHNQQEIKALIPPGVSARTRRAILAAMAPSAFERTPDMEHFIADLSDDAADDSTLIFEPDEDPDNENGSGGGNSHGGNTVSIVVDPEPNNKRKILVIVAAVVAVVVVGLGCWALFGLKGDKPAQTPQDIIVVTDTIGPAPQDIIADTPADTPADEPVDTLVAAPAPADTPAPATENKPDKPTPDKPKPDKPKPTVPAQPTTGTLTVDGGTWRGGILGGKANGNGRITFSTNTRFHGYEVSPGDYFEGYYVNGRLDGGNIYYNNGNKQPIYP